MNAIGPTLIAVFAGIVTLAMLAVIVSRNAQTANVISGAGSALANIIGAAVAPVTSSGTNFGAATALGPK